MGIEIKLSQKLSQSLVMTPQLQQAIKLLQLSRQDYLEAIERELEENPLLESDPDAEPEHDRKEPEPRPTTGEEMYESLDSRYPNKRGDFDGERGSIESNITAQQGLVDHLLWQLKVSDTSDADRAIAGHIAGNLDVNGYLCSTIEEIAAETKSEIADVERVLAEVQSLDPPGIAARDLRECLLIQLDQLGLSESLAGKLVRDHLPDLEHRRYEALAKQLKITLSDINEALKVIKQLEPRPGRPYVDENPVYITPDVYVKKVGNDFLITMNESGLPRLRLNSEYSDIVKGENGFGASAKDFINDKLRSANWLIKSIEQRKQTIYKVAESIVKFQRDFFEVGVSGLKPLVLKDVAEDVGMHESTISRVTSNKYLHTEQGVYELKFFFSSGLKSTDGDVSSESVKNLIKELVAGEPPKSPLSDQDIALKLKASGIDIARRTVAKYREMMGIPSSSRRKNVF